MAFDGVFIHYLVQELKEKLKGGKINKIYQPSLMTLVLNIRAHHENHQLLISSELNAPRLHLTTKKYDNPEHPSGFCMLLRKYLERGIIEDFYQIDNDRIVALKITSLNDLGDTTHLNLYLEIMGRNSNIILTNQDQVIIDSVRKLPPSDIQRSIIPRAIYQFPNKTASINPFNQDLEDYYKFSKLNNLEGCSKLLQNEFIYHQSVNRVLFQKKAPTIIQTGDKQFFYAYDLKHLEGKRLSFASLSVLLDKYFSDLLKVQNVDYTLITKIIKKEINRANHKLTNLDKDLLDAKKQIESEQIALLLQANLYLVKPGMGAITVENYFNNLELVTITLNPNLTPSDNLKNYFHKLKKAKSAVFHINEQIRHTHDEISYLETILSQLTFVNHQELQEIKSELRQYGYLKADKKERPVFKKKITSYQYDGYTIFIGKNNDQNNYLTHTLASKNDYWFHVKDAPGAHVILKSDYLNEVQIRTAAQFAVLFSKLHASSSVGVDYTLVKNIKKIPGLKGSHVSYSNQKTIYIDPDPSILVLTTN